MNNVDAQTAIEAQARTAIWAEVSGELDYQETKWGHEIDDTKNTPWMWHSYITNYAGKWMVGSFVPLGQNTVSEFRRFMIKTAAICVSAVRSIDRQREANGKTFYE